MCEGGECGECGVWEGGGECGVCVRGEGGEFGMLGEGGCMREKWRKCVGEGRVCGEGYKGIGGSVMCVGSKGV